MAFICVVSAAETSKEAEEKRKAADGSGGKAKSGPEPIVISIVLKMAEFDHKVVIRFFFFCFFR